MKPLHRLFMAMGVILSAAPLAHAQPKTEQGVPVKTVVVRGIGADKDEAEKDAILKAVHKVVGLYIDAETRAKNEEITEQILVFTKGQIHSSQRTKGPEAKDGLTYVEMKVTVEVADLKERIRRANFAVQNVPGEEIARKIKAQDDLSKLNQGQDEDNAKNLLALLEQFNTAKMIRPNKGLRWTNLNDGNDTTSIKVEFFLEPDPAQWKEYRERLTTALKKTLGGVRPGSFKSLGVNPGVFGSTIYYNLGGTPWAYFLGEEAGAWNTMKQFNAKNNAEWGYYLYVLRDYKIGENAEQTTEFVWEVFPVAKQVIQDLPRIKAKPIQVVVSLVDKAGQAVEEKTMTLKDAMNLDFAEHVKQIPFYKDTIDQVAHFGMVAPFPWWDSGCLFAIRSGPKEVTLQVNKDDVSRVAKVVVHVK